MKVTLPDNYKYSFTVWDTEQAKNVIKVCKEDCEKPIDICTRHIVRWLRSHNNGGKRWGYPEAVVVQSVTVQQNRRIEYSRLGDNTGCFDVHFDGYACFNWGCVQFGFLLSDYWDYSDDDDTTVHMYARVAEFPPFTA